MTLRELLGKIMPMFLHLDIECYDGDNYCDESYTAFLDSIVLSYSFYGIDSCLGWRTEFDATYIDEIAFASFHADYEPILTVRLMNLKFDYRFSIRYDRNGVLIQE